MSRKIINDHPYAENAQRLRELVKSRKGWVEQKEIALTIGFTAMAVNHWLIGSARPSPKAVRKLSSYLGMLAAELMAYYDGEKQVEWDDVPIGNSFGERIRWLVDASRKTVPQIAKEIGVSNETINNYLREGAPASAIVLLAIADYFDVSTDWLLCRPGAQMRLSHEK